MPTDDGHPSDGPFVSVAAICEKVLEDKENVLSLIRLVDTITINVQGQTSPTEMPAINLPITIVVCLKSGGARGSHQLSLESETPDGATTQAHSQTVLFRGQEVGVNNIFRIQMGCRLEGVYWFNVVLDGRRLTRIPLRIVYRRVSTG